MIKNSETTRTNVALRLYQVKEPSYFAQFTFNRHLDKPILPQKNEGILWGIFKNSSKKSYTKQYISDSTQIPLQPPVNISH
jgi:hypothetical protein